MIFMCIFLNLTTWRYVLKMCLALLRMISLIEILCTGTCKQLFNQKDFSKVCFHKIKLQDELSHHNPQVKANTEKTSFCFRLVKLNKAYNNN